VCLFREISIVHNERVRCVDFLETLSASISNYPNYDNYVMSASALLRLQDTYALETSSIATGRVSSSAASSLAMSGTFPVKRVCM